MAVIGMIVGTIFWSFMLLLAVGAFIGTVMMFDSPGSRDNVILWMIYYSHLSFFPLTVTWVLGSWVAFIIGSMQVAAILIMLPFINVVLFLGGFAYVILFRGGRFDY